MEILELDPADGELVSGVFDLLCAAHEADRPEGAPPHQGVFTKSLAHPSPEEDEHRFVAVDDGRVVGWLSVGLPNRENLHFAGADLIVHPERRREGIGSALLERLIALCRSEGRTDLTLGTIETWENGPIRDDAGQKFLEKHGFTRALTCVVRSCSVDALDPESERTLMEGAEKAAGDDYEIISWIGRTPAELIDTMCRIDSMILSEVPLGELDLEPEHIDAELKEAKAVRNEAVGIIPVHTIARHKESGEAVANTAIGVFDDPDFEHAFQWITIVDPAHRGHRLGTLVKLVNLRLFKEQFPNVKTIWTDNADVNAHMIDINVKMGYETFDAWVDFQLKLDS